MRYRITFIARKNEDFNWETNEVFESNDLLELIFEFQIMIDKEYNRILEESNKMISKVDDDISF